MKTQNFENHVRMHPLYHYVLLSLVLASLITAIVNLVLSLQSGENIWSALAILLMAAAFVVTFILLRIYPLRVQDRAIRAEENLRHFILTGKPFDSRLTLGQIVALRFASDAELPGLSKVSADEGLTPKDIKKRIMEWRADHNRI
ncbi:hypothetical protein JOC95_002890 [Bacillus tianshenii]|uniref:Uncharacterized protein n=1 Tax=Sutcliffiella tianshenii TaxID=1463404 RepID=A0ABS2P304_9BACI|nr:DUF6526 family protein [Bacillus tianshenii]MBM7621017.1 hypothetical protein [Bacillus tianshenii]